MPTPTELSPLGPLPDGVAPARPAALDQPPTLDGAKAVATYFLLLYSYTYQTGDAAPWIALSDPRCVFCSGVTQKAQTQHSEGQRLVGGAIQVTAADGTEVNPASFFDLTLSVTQAPSKTVDVTGTTISQTTGGDRPANVIVINDGTWHIREISINPRGKS